MVRCRLSGQAGVWKRLGLVAGLSVAGCSTTTPEDNGIGTAPDVSMDGSEPDGTIDSEDRSVDSEQDGGAAADASAVEDRGSDALNDPIGDGATDCLAMGGLCIAEGQTPECSGIAVCPKGTALSSLRCEEAGTACCLPSPVVTGSCSAVGGTCSPYESSRS